MAYKGSTGTSMSYIQGGRRRKHKAAKPSTSCTKCIHFVDAGDRMFCDLKHIYKRYRNGCKNRVVADIK